MIQEKSSFERYIISENCFIKIASKHQYKEKWLERLAMEKSDKLDGSKGFEILYLCHPQTGQASKEEKIKAELYGALQLLLGGAAESYTQLMCSQHTAKARHCCIPVQLSAQRD